MHSNVFNVGPGEVIIIADFKENLHIVLNRDSEVVAHSCDDYGIHFKKVYTVLSLYLSHTAGFVLKCLKLIFDQDEFHSIEKAKWWSYNGPHFKNHEQVNVLLDEQIPFISSIKFNVNFFAAQHGKSECNGAFGYFSRLLKTSIPESGVQSFNDLVEFFIKQTENLRNEDDDNFQKYQFFKITCSKLLAKAKKLVVSNFRQSLSFTSSDGLLVSAPVSEPEEDQKVTSPFKSKLGEVSSKVKRSTAPVNTIDVFDELVKNVYTLRTTHMLLHQLSNQLTVSINFITIFEQKISWISGQSKDFEEAKQVKKDNKYIDETIPQYYEVPVIGFNSAEFDTSILIKNLKSKDWTISKFVDFKIYSMQHKLKDVVRDFGNGQYKKDRFPYEFIDTNNYLSQLNKCERFQIEAFDNKLRNKKLSEDKYKEYLVQAAKHKSLWDYLKHYNILDTRVLIEPIDYLIELMFKYNADMLAIKSMSLCSNAIKYSMEYNGFDINGDYNCESTDKSIKFTQNYWRAKVGSHNQQDNKKGRDSINNVTIDDYDYFKELFKNLTILHVQCQVYMEKQANFRSNRQQVRPIKKNYKKLIIQQRKYALMKQLPMTLISDEGYWLFQKGITGGLSQVTHRYNIADETKIKQFEQYKENK
ncbi:MAG: hypothetical protein EZS28_012432 [Streblomastix strix]|uniref:Uncharacterized protein n=1 Tax=Streblomastix strix TaxID=222440 RepID=A0A5J4WBJ5_9EUKA|nr:MAG: hypothetical protein EZS28_012432 [Streblomastix strix]